MLRMFSYPRRPKGGQITCYLNRTYHVLTTLQGSRDWQRTLHFVSCQQALSSSTRICPPDVLCVLLGLASPHTARPFLLHALRKFPANFTAFAGLAMTKSASILEAGELGYPAIQRAGIDKL